MRNRDPNIGMSLLDIISCALGASIVLAILFSVIKTPLPTPTSGQFILIEITGSAEKTSKSGFIIGPPGQAPIAMMPTAQSIRAVTAQLQELQLLSDLSLDISKDKNTMYLVLTEPVKDEWFITPYLVDDSNSTLRQYDYTVHTGKMRWWTKDDIGKQTKEGFEFNFKHAGEIDVTDSKSRVIKIH